MELLKKCKICGKSDFKFLFEQKDKAAGTKGKYKLVKCKNCSAIFLNPFPEPEDIGSFYPKSYYSYSCVDSGSWKFKLKMKSYGDFNKKFGLRKVLMSPLNFFFRSVPPKKGKLLDIGCGSGQYLYEMKQLGFDVYGSEIGDFDEASNKKLGLNIKRENFVKENKYKSNSFDVVTLNHVLEHMDKPIESIREIRRILKKGGRFYVGVPNSSSLAYGIFGKNWYQLDVPRHLIDYNERLLREILEGEGFKVIGASHNPRPSQFTASLMYSLGKKEGGKICRLLDLIFLIPTYLSAAIRKGDQIEIECVKK